jgi:outer membrane lipoprotein SlyB
MKNFWVAILSVLCITFFAGTASATAPVADDIPDFKMLTGTGQLDDFDLDDYVTDYDDGPDGISWSVDSVSGFDGGANTPSYSIVDPLLDIGGSAVVTTGVFTFKVEDASEYATDSSVVKYSSLMMAQPGLTQDNNLSPEDVVTRTMIVEADATLTSPELTQLISPESASDADLYVSIADLDGNLLAGDNTASAAYGDLEASISGSGELVLKAPAGSYPITGLYQLTGAYRVGVKAKKTGGVGENWDGAEFVVAQSMFPTKEVQNNATRLDKFNNFEGLAVGALSSKATMTTNEEGWYLAQTIGAGAAEIVDTGIPASTWATSGQALKISLTDPADLVYVQSQFFTDIQPGETITMSMNVTSDAPELGPVPGLITFLGNPHITSNNCGVTLQQGSGTGDTAELPVASNWRTVKLSLVADPLGAAVEDGTETVNFYEKGYVCNIIATAGSAVNVYIDNVRVYRSALDKDLAFGNTVAHVVGVQDASDDLFDGTFEGGDTLEAVGWLEKAGDDQGTAQIDTSGVNSMFTHDGDNSLEMFVPGNGRSGTLVEFAFTKLQLDATAAGEANYDGEGIYGLSAWVKTNSPDVKSLPDLLIALSDPKFKNVAFNSTGMVGLPLNLAPWKQVYCSSARVTSSLTKLWPFIVVSADVLWTTDGGHIRSAYWGSYGTIGSNPCYEADAHIYIDDMKVHKMQDECVYFDRSVFPVAD